MENKTKTLIMKAINLFIIGLIIVIVSCEKETEESLIRKKVDGNYSYYSLRFGTDHDTVFHYIDTITDYSLVSKSGNNFYR